MGIENPDLPASEPEDEKHVDKTQPDPETEETPEQRRIRLANEEWYRERQQSRWRFKK